MKNKQVINLAELTPSCGRKHTRGSSHSCAVTIGALRRRNKSQLERHPSHCVTSMTENLQEFRNIHILYAFCLRALLINQIQLDRSAGAF